MLKLAVFRRRFFNFDQAGFQKFFFGFGHHTS